MRKNLIKTSLVLALFAQFAGAQEPEKLKEVVVRDVPIEQDILPTAKPFNSAFGMNLSVLDTPRNVTIVSREELDAISVRNVRDFSKLTSSAFTGNNFGAPTQPNIRGQVAEAYVNGMRKGLTSNGNGLPINFNAVEAVNIGKGPGGAVWGNGQYNGGYVDYQTKRPYEDKLQGSVEATVGMYDQYRWTLDFGGPLIKDKLAFRVSYSGEESDSYYENGNQNLQAFYSALSWKPAEDLTVDFNNEFATYDYTENFGINRVTQELIDNRIYQTGIVGAPNADGSQNPANINGGFNSVTLGPKVKLSRRVRNLAPGDGSTALSYNAQTITKYQADPDFYVVNNNLVQYIDRYTRSSYFYNEVLKDNLSFENRTEFHFNFDTAIGGSGGGESMKDSKQLAAVTAPKPTTFGHEVVTGLAVRYQDNLNYNDYFNEPASAWDLSRPRSEINYVNQLASGSLRIPGEPARFTFSQGNGDTTESNEIMLAPFYQHRVEFTDKLALLAGWRTEALFVEANDPPGSLAPVKELDTNQVLLNGNVGPTYKFFPWMTGYANFNYSESRSSANGGGVDPYTTTAGFHQESFLYEAGFKFSLLNDTLFVTVTGYNQNLLVPSQFGPSNQAEANGFEFESKYQPNKNFYASVGYSFIDAYIADDFMIQQYPINDPNAPSFFPGSVVTGTFGAAGPAPSRANPAGSNRQRMLGLPQHSFNGLVNYKFDFGLGANLGATFNSEQDLNYLRTVEIPFQYSIDATVYYTQPRYEVRLAFLNLTDEKNWSPAGSGFQPGRIYNLDGIVPELPFRVEATAKFKF